MVGQLAASFYGGCLLNGREAFLGAGRWGGDKTEWGEDSHCIIFPLPTWESPTQAIESVSAMLLVQI